MRLHLLPIWLLLSISPIWAQEEILEPYVGEREMLELNQLFDELSAISENPFNLNSVTKQQLDLLPFLSALQIENILFYCYAHGPMQSIYELQLVEELDRQTIQSLLPYVFVAPIPKTEPKLTFSELFAYGKSQLHLQSTIPFEQKEGYLNKSDSLLLRSKKYLGDPTAVDLRYQFQSRDKLQVGFRANKGAGESFQHGFDYYAGYLMIKEIGLVNRLILGDYRLSFGQGLLLSHNFTFGKTNLINTVRKRTSPLRGSISGENTPFFRGAATTLKLSPFDLTIFWSERLLDATVTDTSATSIKRDGRHRTLSEWEKKNNLSVTHAGGNTQRQIGKLRLGTTFLFEAYSLPIAPKVSDANRFIFRGDRNYNLSTDYHYNRRRLSLFGEAALSRSGGFALLNGVVAQPATGISLSLLQRYYSVDYHANSARAFSTTALVQNEEGYYFGYQIESIRRWRLSGYLDFFRFPWIKSNAQVPSGGWEYQSRIEFLPSRKLQFRLNYKHAAKEINSDSSTDEEMLLFGKRDRFRFDSYYFPQSTTRLRFAGEYAFNQKQEMGFSIGASLDHKPPSAFYQLALSLFYFHSDASSLRMNSNEKSMLYSFYVPALFGEGVRAAMQAKYSFGKVCYLIAKYSLTCYADRLEIGSGLERIAGRYTQEVALLTRFAF